MMFLLLLFFRTLSTKANNNATTAESSEDELNGYDKVVVSQNLAEEILDEIYGKIEAFNPVTTTTATQVYENSVVNENGAIDAPFHLHDPNINQPKSLADEILDELYGRKSASNGSGPSSPRAALGHQKSGISKKKVELAVVDHPYEEIQSRTKISAADLEHSPAITGKRYHMSFFRRVVIWDFNFQCCKCQQGLEPGVSIMYVHIESDAKKNVLTNSDRRPRPISLSISNPSVVENLRRNF